MKDIPNRHILLVEDQIIIGMSQKMQLEQRGYKVTHVSTGEEALESINQSDSRYDLILMDIDLGPGLDGIQTTERITVAYDIPVLFLSSHTDPEIVAKTEIVTSYGYVVKNTGITVLEASIKMAFKLYGARKKETSKREEAENTLQTTESYLEQVIENMLEGFLLVEAILDNNGQVQDIQYLEVNQAAEKISGIARDTYLGKTARQIFNDNVESVFFEKHTQVLKTGKAVRFTDHFSELNVWYELSIYKVEDNKLAIFFQDITNRITAEAALKASESKYRGLFNNMGQEVHFWKLIKDDIGKIKTWELVDANPLALKAWGKKREEVIGKLANEVFDGYDATGFFLPIVQKIFTEMQPHSWETNYEVTGQHLFMTSVPFDDFFVTTGIDITNNKLLEEQVHIKETLLKDVIHRIKNNFSSLLAILKLQGETSTHPEAQMVIHEFMGRIESLRQVYDKLLTSDGHQEIGIKSYLEDLSASIIKLIPENANVKINLETDDFIIPERHIFPIGSIVNELITNSLKHAFNPNRNGQIDLWVRRSNGHIELDYRDNGKGLPSDVMESKKGLGLMLIDLFTQQLHGLYSLDSDRGFHCNIKFKA